jgi:dTDP-4-dehydrorhamnose reductase
VEARGIPLKLLITGAIGLYGSKLERMAVDRGIEVYASDVQQMPVTGTFVKMDVSNKEMVNEAFKQARPDVVVHAATLTDVDKCELNKELATKINVEGTRNIVEAAKAVGSFLIYISTDYVFNGEKGMYREDDKPDPIQHYGVTKLQAEQVVKGALDEYFIARPSVIYGSTPAAGKVNFALWLIETLRKGEHVKIVTDQYTYHLCGATKVSRFEFAQQIAEAFGLDKNLIDPVLSSQFKWPAKRPMDSSLDTSKAQRTLKHKPLLMQEALKQLKTELAPSSS